MNTNRSFHSVKFSRRFFLTTAGSFAASTLFASCNRQVSQGDKAKLPPSVRIAWWKGNIGFFILKAKGDLDKRFKKMQIRTIVDCEGFTANRAYTIATPTFSRNYPDVIKVIGESQCLGWQKSSRCCCTACSPAQPRSRRIRNCLTASSLWCDSC